MQKYFSYLSAFFAVVMVGSMVIVPITAEAATTPVKKASVRATRTIAYDLYNPRRRYGDEKIEITDATSRCNTPAMRKQRLADLERAKQDGKPYGLTFDSVSGTKVLTPIEEAYGKYLDGLDMAWEAMQEPYCGFGAFGTKAAIKSYNKSVTHSRTRFLDAAKKTKTVAFKAVK